MKKSTKSEKPAAPQVKSATKKAVEPSPVKKTVAPKKVSAPKPAAPPAAPTPTAIPVVATPPTAAERGGATTIVARVDVGFGNNLFIRGDGPGLSWDRGVLMTCVADDQWSFSIPSATRRVVYKLLLNDMTWSAGEDYSVAPGATAVERPSF